MYSESIVLGGASSYKRYFVSVFGYWHSYLVWIMVFVRCHSRWQGIGGYHIAYHFQVIRIVTDRNSQRTDRTALPFRVSCWWHGNGILGWRISAISVVLVSMTLSPPIGPLGCRAIGTERSLFTQEFINSHSGQRDLLQLQTVTTAQKNYYDMQ